MSKYLPISELADIYNYDPSHLRHMVIAGKLRAKRDRRPMLVSVTDVATMRDCNGGRKDLDQACKRWAALERELAQAEGSLASIAKRLRRSELAIRAKRSRLRK